MLKLCGPPWTPVWGSQGQAFLSLRLRPCIGNEQCRVASIRSLEVTAATLQSSQHLPPLPQLWKVGNRNSSLSFSPGKPKQQGGAGFGLWIARDELSGPRSGPREGAGGEVEEPK